NSDGTPNPDIPCLLDVNNYIGFMLANFYVGNSDWPHHNWYAARQEDPGSTGFKSFTWDAEWVVDMNSGLTANKTGVTNSIAEPYEHLRHNEDFQLLFADIAHWAFSPGGPLYVNPDAPAWDPAHPENNQPAALWAELCDWVELSVIAETARWGDIGHPGDPATFEDWQDERDWILNTYMPQRSDIVLDHLRGAGLYPDVDAPLFEINGTPLYGGTVEDGDSLAMTSGETTIYYTLDGMDPRAFDGTVSGSAQAYGGAITLTENEHFMARVYHGSEWSALSDAFFFIGADDLRITEIMYNPADPTPGEMAAGYTDSDDFEYVELQNIGDDPISLTGLGFFNGIDFTFPMVDLDPGGYALVVRNQDAFEYRYGTGLNVVGEFVSGTSLANGGEEVELATCYGGVILEFDYQDNWFNHTDGEGFSLVINDPTQDPGLWDAKTGWKPSWQFGGSPGAADPGPDLHAVVVNELRAHSPDGEPDGDWIELLNLSDDTVDVDGWYLSDDPDDLTAFQITSAVGDTELLPGEYLVLTAGSHFGTAFALSEFGEAVYLTAIVGQDDIFLAGAPASWPDGWALGGYREDEFFGASLTGDTFGRYIVPSTGDKEFVRVLSPTPGDTNAAPIIPDVVINEIMYNPPETPVEGNEYIELLNRTGADVPLYDPAHPENTFKFTDGIAFTFPAGAYVPADGYALVVQTDPAAFRTEHGIPESVNIYGPYDLNLA
ncbi:MAG: lamin tail domain-containing protein, partial [Planctomycetota bacterium]|nr:lamin tail domain-containing protein [Planctomycetota bacterium]